MKTRIALALALALALPAYAGPPAPASQNPLANVPPPPGLNDPGVTTATPPTASTAATAAPATANPNDELSPPAKPDNRPVRDKASREAERAAAGEEPVTIRKVGEDTVEEYRDNGRVWMIRIIPRIGPVQVYMDTNGSGRLHHDPKEGPVSPVYYTLYTWD